MKRRKGAQLEGGPSPSTRAANCTRSVKRLWLLRRPGHIMPGASWGSCTDIGNCHIGALSPVSGRCIGGVVKSSARACGAHRGRLMATPKVMTPRGLVSGHRGSGRRSPVTHRSASQQGYALQRQSGTWGCHGSGARDDRGAVITANASATVQGGRSQFRCWLGRCDRGR